MTFPVSIPVGPWRLHPHAVFEVLAYFVAFQTYRRLRRLRGDVIDAETRWSIVAAAVAGAAIGSRLLFWLEDPSAALAHWRDPAFLFAGKTIVGAILGGLIGVEVTKRAIGVRTRTGDLFVIPLCVGIAIGRIGCFLSGLEDQTYGSPTSLPWAVDFGDGIGRHPTQLYESLFAVLLAVFLATASRRPHRDGDLFRLFVAAYMAWRLLIDILKPELRLALGLSALQWAALAAVLFYAHDVRRWLRLQKAR